MFLVRLYVPFDDNILIEGEIYNAKYSIGKNNYSILHYLDIYLPNGKILKELYIGRFHFLSKKETRKYKIEQLMNII